MRKFFSTFAKKFFLISKISKEIYITKLGKRILNLYKATRIEIFLNFLILIFSKTFEGRLKDA